MNQFSLQRAISKAAFSALGTIRAARLLPLALLLLLALPAAVQAQFNYTTNNGTITITGYTGPGGDVTVPDQITGLSVTKIWVMAFMNRSSMTHVTIPGSVTNIGWLAFAACDNLRAISVDALNSFYSSAEGCLFDKSQTTLVQCPGGKTGNYTVPSSAKSIGDSAFSNCRKLTGVTIPDGVTKIERSAFSQCTSLASITLPTNLTSIADSTFSGCSGLTNVSIPASVTNIGSGAFGLCMNLTVITVDALNAYYSSVGGVLFNKSQTSLIQYPGNKRGNYSVPNGVTNIGDYAFSTCHGLTNVTLPNSLCNIGIAAFHDCNSLTEVTIPASVTNIGSIAFSGCTSMTVITVAALNSFYRSVDGVLFNLDQTTLIQCPAGKAGNYTAPDSVTSIGRLAFVICDKLTSAMFPNSLTNIGYDAFEYCTSLSSITIPYSVANIETIAFEACTNLTRVYCLGNAPSVGFSVFFGDNQATVYYLPGTTGWGPTFGERPTALWKPQVQSQDASFGMRTNQFGFNISWANGQVVAVEACTNLANPIWSPLLTNTLSSDTFYFSDPAWTNYPGRFYRLRSP